MPKTAMYLGLLIDTEDKSETQIAREMLDELNRIAREEGDEELASKLDYGDDWEDDQDETDT